MIVDMQCLHINEASCEIINVKLDYGYKLGNINTKSTLPLVYCLSIFEVYSVFLLGHQCWKRGSDCIYLKVLIGQ